tara:strand:- start:65 stop:565 length:501 start_codon:yes stop_codon:yes gene_type:complete
MSRLAVDKIVGANTESKILIPGHVAQVVQGTLTTHAASNSETYHDTGLTVSITPGATTSKVLITVQMYIAGADTTFFQLVRGSTAIAVGTEGTDADHRGFTMSREGATNLGGTHGVVFLDSPNTTSATTYKVQARNDAAAYYFINRREADTNFGLFSSIVAQEIAQ